MSLCRDLRTSSSNPSVNGDVLSTPATSRSPTQPTSGFRRRRDSNDFDYLEEDFIISRPAGTCPITPGTTKRLKTSCEDTARLYGVEVEQLKPFAEAPTILHMLVCLEARLLKIEKALLKKQCDDILETPDFKSALQERLFIALLSPGIPAYVTEVTPRIMTVIRERSEVFKVPQEIFEDPHLYGKLDSMVSEILTSCRSNIKQKIEASFKDDGETIHIGLLVQRILPKGVLITADHWARIAFLRSALRDFVKFTGLKKPVGAHFPLRQRTNNIDSSSSTATTSGGLRAPTRHDDIRDNDSNCGDDNQTGNDGHSDEGDAAITGKDYTQHQFWNYVDDYLSFIHNDLFQHLMDPAARRNKIVWFFGEALQVDVLNYKGGSRIPPPPSNNQVPIWQDNLQRSVRCL